MTNKTLVDALPALQKLAKQELTIGTLYKVSKLLDRLENEACVYHKMARSLIEKYCTVENGTVTPKSDTAEEFNDKFDELLNYEIDLGEIKPIEIPTSENIKLSYNDLLLIKEFITISEK